MKSLGKGMMDHFQPCQISPSHFVKPLEERKSLSEALVTGPTPLFARPLAHREAGTSDSRVQVRVNGCSSKEVEGAGVESSGKLAQGEPEAVPGKAQASGSAEGKEELLAQQ